MSELLSVPLKTTSEVDWVSPLRVLFNTTKIEQDFNPSIMELNRLRTLAVSGKQLDKSQIGVETISRYYDQITALEPKIPFESLKIFFSWEDAFDKGTLFGGKASTSLPFIVFERYCVLFNLGAFLSQLGAGHQLADSDEEMKTVAKWFQTSSGIFAHLASSIEILSSEPLSVDLNTDTLSSLSGLMLAQAQEIFVTKAIKDKMKDSLIAKLCTQAEDMYSDSLLKMTKENIKHQWDRLWLSNVAGKQLAFAGLAQFFQSRACSASKRVGEQIARLNLCIEYLTKAQNKIGNTTLYSYYITEATRLGTEAKKDNDFIYHEQVPESSSLSSIDKVPSARLAKPANISQQQNLSTNFTDLFRNLKQIPAFMNSPASPCMTKQFLATESTTEVRSENEGAKSAPVVTSSNPEPTGSLTENTENVAANNYDTSSPLRQAIDASVYAVGYYMKQYLKGDK